ncbi:hypothetical protein Tco_0876361 [Tanacetum coccineum]|uniref:Uncharacterized protein n=1 Tax=Tanacetum coccineum TaxID=301880 RepID=A0ABQ5BS24_9ASTR
MSQPANDEFSQHLSDEESNHEDASDTGAAPKQQQQVIPQTTAISNIKLPILKKEEYDIWAMEMEHYLEYIDNEVWKVIQNGNSKKRISTGKDGIVRVLSPVTAAEIQAVEKERKAKNILLMAIPKEHMRRFHGMDDAKEIWEAIRTRFGGNANSKKMQKAVFKQQFEAFKISNSEGLEKGYDRFQQLLSQLEAHGAEVSTFKLINSSNTISNMYAYKVLLIPTCRNQQGGRSRCILDSVLGLLLSLKQRLSKLGEKVEAMPKSAWTEKDQINNFLKERRLMRSLDSSLVGDCTKETYDCDKRTI